MAPITLGDRRHFFSASSVCSARNQVFSALFVRNPSRNSQMIASHIRYAFLVAGAAAATTLSLFAQTAPSQAPAASPPAPAGQTGAPPADGGRGQGRGRGPSMTEPDFSKKPPVVPLTPAEEAKRFWLPPGFKLEPVLSDPDIEEPAQIAFDGNGRMFVLELRGYMQDADASGELDPVGRISVHEDRDGDGVYETHKIFVDKMIFPRFVLPFGANAILSKESNSDEVYKYTDTNNDGTADKKELFATGLGRLLNVEHQESGFIWGMDNWIYSTINSARIRWTPTGVLREPTGSNGGQWGVTQDNYGKVWFQAGASGMPGYFQLPIVYGNFNYPQQFEPELNLTWGAPVRIADMQGGMGVVRMPDGSLAQATGAAGNDVFRGDRLPKDMIGDYFYGEVVARIVRRLRPVKTEGLTQLRNVYPLSEFIRSTDPLFRPVDLTTAPDGTLYITDMYRGIIQESQWSGPGTYLRQRIDQYALDKVVRHGRIWRLTYEGMGRRTETPRMLQETTAQLLAHLSDSNGWWRDTAQQLLVLKQDKSVVPMLRQLARTSDQLARIHAMWTLEGLGAADAAFLREMMKDADPQVRTQAIRVSESLYKAGDKSFAADYKSMTSDADTDVVIQAMMTLNTLKVAEAPATVKAVFEGNKAKGAQLVANAILNPAAAGGRGGLESIGAATLTPAEQTTLDKGREIYGQVCFACHGEDGRGEAMPGAPAGTTRAPALASSPRVLGHQDYVIKALLHGLTGPVNGTNYTEVMVPMGQSPDDWIAAIASYVRNSFGNRASLVAPEEVARVRSANAARKNKPWMTTELEASLPKAVLADGWKLSASHNPAIASQALGINPWTSGHAQEPGMWFQVELPQPAMITEIQFTSTALAVDTTPIVPGAPTRTGIPGGRGAPGAPAAAPPPLGYPREYQVQMSMDGTNWGPQPVARGKGTGTLTDIVFPPTRAKFVRITQSATSDAPWTIQRLRLFEPGASAGGSK
jgi:putative membrane-bound dehydrogenase-like protein